MDKNRTEFVLDAWRAAWGNGEVDAFERILAPGYVRHTKSGDEDVEKLRQAINDSRAAFPDLVTEILQSVEQDDMVAIRWTSHGTHTGSFMGVPSTDRTVTVYGASFCRFADGLLAEEWVVWDPRELLSAMSILTVPHE
ncbi:ester cyclase [Geodermatophilus sp. YIM 151500]|uniref:ester cyclase n=1 Tax=Geodermatophilus sp. YIM 151500 TaxID=2984531 RepID=UPI0021E3D8F0|nr:ester cyclase [Geodermatophilus sp. YIM 151500]MCV2489776.1 ester cyclase [Geodermatophilus sp. YIM 151500]